jgi:hypothetical protein
MGLLTAAPTIVHVTDQFTPAVLVTGAGSAEISTATIILASTTCEPQREQQHKPE